MSDPERLNDEPADHVRSAEASHGRIVQVGWETFGFGFTQLFNLAILLFQIAFIFDVGLERDHILSPQGLCFDNSLSNQICEVNFRPTQEFNKARPRTKLQPTRSEK